MEMAEVSRAKPTRDEIFQALAYITLANIPSAKARHMATYKFKKQGNAVQQP